MLGTKFKPAGHSGVAALRPAFVAEPAAMATQPPDQPLGSPCGADSSSVDAGAQAITAVEGGRGNASRLHEHTHLIDDADRLVAVHFRRPSYRRMRVQAVIGHSNEPSPRRHTGADRRVTGACHVAVQHATGIVCLHDRPGFPFPWQPESSHA
jgi:hypothetical protein